MVSHAATVIAQTQSRQRDNHFNTQASLLQVSPLWTLRSLRAD